MVHLRCAALFSLLLMVAPLSAQSGQAAPVFSRLNSFAAFGEYSNNSSHILLGNARQRKLLDFGVSYSLRILLRPLVDVQYIAEARPLILESDPVVNVAQTVTFPNDPADGFSFQFNDRQVGTCHPSLSTITGKDGQGNPFTTTITRTCGERQWTFGQGLSPAGLKLNLLPRHRLQPVITAMGGYLFTTQPIPVDNSGSFNFTLEIGAGLELYRSREGSKSLFGNRSIRAEYRYHHISNKSTAQFNPGIDSGVLQITYAFGR